jgi:hypothetical protein
VRWFCCSYGRVAVDPSKEQPHIFNISFINVSAAQTSVAGAFVGAVPDSIYGLHFQGCNFRATSADPWQLTNVSVSSCTSGRTRPPFPSRHGGVSSGVIQSGGSLGCFVEHAPSATTNNICRGHYHVLPAQGSVSSCADACVADRSCIMFAWQLHATAAGPSRQCRLSYTCKQPTTASIGFDGFFRNSTSGKCAPRPSPAPTPAPSGVPGQWELVFLTDAAKRGAVCIDGSPGAYYIRTANAAGLPSDPQRLVLFMEGGGWTHSLNASVARAETDLGSSKRYPPTPTRMEGVQMFGTAPFDTHTIVYAKYCDGGSWTGALSNPPLTVGNTTLYFRGRGLLDGLFEDLFAHQGLASAQELLFAGCSAGGLTTYIHADAVAARMRARAPQAKVLALADAMFSLNHDDYLHDGHCAQPTSSTTMQL